MRTGFSLSSKRYSHHVEHNLKLLLLMESNLLSFYISIEYLYMEE
jgi:hypothetical protein